MLARYAVQTEYIEHILLRAYVKDHLVYDPY